MHLPGQDGEILAELPAGTARLLSLRADVTVPVSIFIF